MLNITAVGRLGKDPELRTIPGKDYEITAFSLAVNVFAKGEEQTVWLKCSLWGKKGEVFREYVRKGSQVTISGKLFQDEWVNKDGETVKDICVDVQDFSLPPREQPQQQSHRPRRLTLLRSPSEGRHHVWGLCRLVSRQHRPDSASHR